MWVVSLILSRLFIRDPLAAPGIGVVNAEDGLNTRGMHRHWVVSDIAKAGPIASTGGSRPRAVEMRPTTKQRDEVAEMHERLLADYRCNTCPHHPPTHG
jgi:hypothetical protein